MTIQHLNEKLHRVLWPRRSRGASSRQGRLVQGTRRRSPSARSQRGMTLLEIMIVLAILALVMGLVVGPRVMAMFSDSKVDVARATVQQFAHQAYTQWSMQNRSKACPDKIEDLTPFMNSPNVKDPWDSPYKMFCGPTLPAGAKGLAILSFGPDAKEGTSDDIKSWE